ncbi:hypothetical protein DYB31_010942, partial [Aphanomyces astaci]
HFNVWNTASPAFRYWFLVLLALIPFAAHFVTNQMGALQQFMLDDKAFPITNTMYGALNSAVSVPNMIIPFFGGHMIDSRGHYTIMFFLVLMFIGHSVVTFGMHQQTFWVALLGRVVYGLGGGSVIVGARAMVAYWFDASEITFAVGVMVAFTSMSKILAKSTVAPVAIYFGSYTYGLLYGLAVCVLSCVVAVVAVRYVLRLKQVKRTFKHADNQPPLDPALSWLNAYLVAPGKRFRATAIATSSSTSSQHMPSLASLRDFPVMFWVLVVMHVVYVNVFHLFLNISSSYLYQVHGFSVVESGIVSSLSHVLVLFAPVAGLVIDRTGGRVIVIVASAALGVVTYALLLFTSTSPVVALLLVSVCLCATPTVLMACVPLTIPKSRFGLAFGIAEVVDALGSFSGNLLVGYIRDATGSYTPVMYLFFALAWVLLGLCILLAVLDTRHGNVLSGKKDDATRDHIVTVADDDDVVVDISRNLYETSSSDDDDVNRASKKAVTEASSTNVPLARP